MARRLVRVRPRACLNNDEDMAPLFSASAPEPTLYELEPHDPVLMLVDSRGNEYWYVDEKEPIGFRPLGD